MNKKRFFKRSILFVLALLFFFSILFVSFSDSSVSSFVSSVLVPSSNSFSSFQTSNVSYGNWTIEGDSVYVNDDKVFIRATPHTISAGSDWVTFDVMTKDFSGNVDIALGFDTDNLRPVQAQYYTDSSWVEEESYTCENKFNYTQDYFWCYADYDGGMRILKEGHYDRGNIATKTAYWNVQKSNDYKDFSSSWNSIDYDYHGTNKWWYLEDVPLTANISRSFRVKMLEENKHRDSIAKYWVAIKPSSQTFSQAIANDNFYVLDPYVEDGEETAFNNVGANGDITTLNAEHSCDVSYCIVKAVGIARGGGNTASEFTVFINQSGTNLATTTISHTGTSATTTFFGNMSLEDYSSPIIQGNYTVEIYRTSGTVEFMKTSKTAHTGSYFSFGGQITPYGNPAFTVSKVVSSCTPSLTNTTWSSWSDTESCQINDYKTQNRSLIQYDANVCGGSNITFWEEQEVSCDYCSYNPVNTSWSSWVDTESCQPNDYLTQNRSLLSYDSNYASCYAVTSLGSDFWTNITYWDYQESSCDYCTPSLTNTTWSSWSNNSLCYENNTQSQIRSLVQYDSNVCGEVSNTTFYDYQMSSCTFIPCVNNIVNTTWSGWSTYISCDVTNSTTLVRSLTQYDANFCGNVSNSSFYDYNVTSCVYTVPSESDAFSLIVDFDKDINIYLLIAGFITSLILFLFRLPVFAGGILMFLSFIMFISELNFIFSLIVFIIGVSVMFKE